MLTVSAYDGCTEFYVQYYEVIRKVREYGCSRPAAASRLKRLYRGVRTVLSGGYRLSIEFGWCSPNLVVQRFT